MILKNKMGPEVSVFTLSKTCEFISQCHCDGVKCEPIFEFHRISLQQIYDASDFTLLCSESNRRGERWTGGDFLSVDKVIVWSNEGRGYLYKLPTK